MGLITNYKTTRQQQSFFGRKNFRSVVSWLMKTPLMSCFVYAVLSHTCLGLHKGRVKIRQIYTMGMSKSNLRVHGFLTFTVICFSLNSVDTAETSYKPSLEIRTSYTFKVVLIIGEHKKDNKKLCFSTSLIALRVLCESKNKACNYCWFSVSHHSK